MSGVPSFVQCLTSQRTAGTLYNTYTTAKSVINPTEVVPLPANYLAVGNQLTFRVFGGLSNVVTATPTFTFQVMIGSVVAWSSGALTTNASANTLLPFRLDLDLRVDSEGSGTSAKLIGGGRITCAALANTTAVVPVTSPAVGTGFDSTAAANLDFWVGISASNAGNGIQIYNYQVFQQRFGS